ncbi:MAG: hypothetical protein K0S67_458, partial [Nitrososphaeraceae archaeon]|nr:hypothetical protein [Nitrososphaeraceae archaeon]
DGYGILVLLRPVHLVDLVRLPSLVQANVLRVFYRIYGNSLSIINTMLDKFEMMVVAALSLRNES